MAIILGNYGDKDTSFNLKNQTKMHESGRSAHTFVYSATDFVQNGLKKLSTFKQKYS